MFDIKSLDNNVVSLSGRFDASQADKASEVLGKIETSYTIDFKDLDYISSAGMGVLLATQKRLGEKGHHLTLINMSNHIRDIFKWAGFDLIFDIE